MTKQNNLCPSFDDIQKYINEWENMSYDEIYAVSEHLYNCDKCADLARAVRLFDMLWEKWTADSHGVAVKWMNSTETSDVLNKNLIKDAKQRIIAACRVINKTPGGAINFVTENIEALVGFVPELKFSYSGTRGGPGQLHDSVVSVSQSGNVVLFSSAFLSGLRVRIEGFSNKHDMEVLLQAEGQEPLVAELTPDSEWEGCWHAVFPDIPLGDHILIFKSNSEIK